VWQLGREHRLVDVVRSDGGELPYRSRAPLGPFLGG
jgi:hypothetical protein